LAAMPVKGTAADPSRRTVIEKSATEPKAAWPWRVWAVTVVAIDMPMSRR